MLSIKQCLQDIANRFNNIFNWTSKECDKDGWHIIEYHNGWCRLYYRQTMTISGSGWNAWGSAYVKDIAAISYPVTFAERPYQSAELQTQNNSGWLNIGFNTISTTGHHQLNRPSTGTSINAEILYRVYGKLGGVTNLLRFLCGRRWSYA